eukprot:TRINITY_DN20733_c0_g1_i2.p1 TRINITY_DN20733_c0_g1~~TRINITY_DN20733_c0_g1_i2.p1  ORF type:complete len:377 (-),score=95.70 TRINITY_DN20733_c0_g1_i2:331-1461(-)
MNGSTAEPLTDSPYQTLEVPKHASQEEIKRAYRKAAMKWHPDRHQGEGEEEATEHFKQVSLSYAILSDPQKRAAFDKGGISGVDLEDAMANISVDDLGTFGGILGGLVGAMGVDMQTAVSVRVLDEAMDPGCLSNANKIEWDTELDGRVAKGAAQFYRLSVTEEQSENGVAIRAWSTNSSDRLKLILFTGDGEPRWQVDAVSNHEYASANKKAHMVAEMVCAPFEMVLTPSAPNPLTMEDPSVALFHRLDKTTRCPVQQIGAGDHLVAVYGDNFLQNTVFKLHAITLLAGSEQMELLKATDQQIRQSQGTITDFEQVYMDARRAFEAAQQRYHEEEEGLEAVLQEQAVCRAALFGIEPKPEGGKRGNKSKAGCAQQ